MQTNRVRKLESRNPIAGELMHSHDAFLIFNRGRGGGAFEGTDILDMTGAFATM